KIEFEFWKEFEALKIYLVQGGNLILSGGATLKTIQLKCNEHGFNILDEYFGIPITNTDAIGRIPATVQYVNNPFFISAIGQEGNNDIDLLLPNPFNNVINMVEGLQPVAFFNDHNSEVIYNFGCRDVGSGSHDPTQEEFDEYNGKPVGLKYETTNNSCYIFGFPLTFMEPEQVKTMMTQILNEIP
ncbi:MAG: hypothetical protein DRH89_08330, partial [Candidatus Cloacimonadota bacterium]